MTGPSQLSALVPRIAGVLAQPANLAIVAGLVVGIAGGTVLVGTSKPSAGETPPAANLALFACPGSGAELTSVPVGTSLLVTARSTDGQWLEAYLGEPGVEYAWAPAADVRLASPPDALPAADCTSATTAQASATPTATIVAVVTATPAATASATASPVAGPTPSATESPAIAPTPTPTLPPTAVPTHTASPTASPTPTPKSTASPTPKPTPSPTPKPTPTPTPKPTATPTPTPTPTPSDTTAPTLSNLIVNPATKIQCISPNDKAVIQVTATDPDDPVSSVTIGVTPPWNQAPYLADMNKVVGSNNWTYTIDSGTGGSDSQVKYTVTAHDSHGNSKSLSASSNSADPSYLGYASNGCIF